MRQRLTLCASITKDSVVSSEGKVWVAVRRETLAQHSIFGITMVTSSAVSASEQAPEDPRIGLVLLDRYRIVKKLGAGGMGDVYEGVHELIGKKLAIKCLHADFSAHPEAVARFQREARAATAVGNEHIVDVSDIGELPDGSPFMVMEYLEGQELAGIVDETKKISIPRAIKIALEILEALHAAHESGVVHRDMKPENVFLIRRGENEDFVKVLDFGISMITENSDAALGRMTQTGVAMGTPNYMSPEQAKGDRDLDHRTDLYSLGVILYEVLTGKVPFSAGTLAVLMTKILTESPRPISDIRDDVPVALDRIILRAMAKAPAVRYEDAEEFADALRPFLDPDYVPDDVFTGQFLAEANSQLGETAILGTPVRPVQATAKLESAALLAEASKLEKASLGEPPASESSEGGSAESGQTALVRELGQTEEDAPVPTFGQATLHNAGISTGTGKRNVIIAASCAAVAAAVFTFTRSGDTEQTAAKEQVVVVTPDAMPLELADAASADITTPPPNAEVLITITAVPQEAQIFVNGAAFPNGEEVHQPRSTTPTQILVSLDGYKLQNTVTVFDRDRSLNYELEKLAGFEKAGSDKGRKRGGVREKKGDTKDESSKTPDPKSGGDSNDTTTKGNESGDSKKPDGKFRESFE